MSTVHALPIAPNRLTLNTRHAARRTLAGQSRHFLPYYDAFQTEKQADASHIRLR